MTLANAANFILHKVHREQDTIEYRFLRDIHMAVTPSALLNAEQIFVLEGLLANTKVHDMAEGQRMLTAIQIATWINSSSGEHKVNHLYESKIWD